MIPVLYDRLVELQGICTGAIGWRPRDWYSATLFDAVTAKNGYDKMRQDRMTESSYLASWIIGHVRQAIWANNFTPPTARDLYNPDVEERAKSDEVQEDREFTLGLFDSTIKPA